MEISRVEDIEFTAISIDDLIDKLHAEKDKGQQVVVFQGYIGSLDGTTLEVYVDNDGDCEDFNPTEFDADDEVGADDFECPF
jgi:hypothetical protein